MSKLRLIEMFDRLWMASELSRRWSVGATPGREIEKEHQNLEEAALSRDAARRFEFYCAT